MLSCKFNCIDTRELEMPSKDKKPAEKQEGPGKSELIQRFKDHPFIFTGTVLILVIVVIAFVFVPAIVPSAQRGSELIFGYYNKTPIKYVPGNFFHSVQYNLSQQQRLSQDDPNYIGRLAQIWGEAFIETAVHLGIQDEMKHAGYIAPEKVVDREVAELPVFQENGRFSAAKYRAMDNNSRMNLWRQTQESITVDLYRKDLQNMQISSKEVPFIVSMNSPKRSFDLAIHSLDSYPDSEINSFVAANPDLFRQTRLSRITVTASEREARQIHNSVKSGASSFEEMARTNSQDSLADRGGDMGTLMAFELRYEITDESSRNQVVSMARGEISDLIKLPYGWGFYRADETSYPADLNDPAQQWKIRSYIMQNERGRVEDWSISEAEKFIALAEETGFSDAIYATGFTRRSLDPISINYGNALPFGSLASAGVPELAAAASNQFFWQHAFSTPINTYSRPLVVGEQIIVLLPLEETHSEDDEDFASMFNSYWSYWLNDITNSAVRSMFMSSDKLEDRFEETFMGLWSF